MINAATTVGVSFPPKHPSYQRDDQYDEFLHTKAIVDWGARRNFRTTKDTDIREYWQVEEYAFNTWVNYQACKLEYNLSLQRIMEIILKGGAIVISGVFASYHHVVCIVGFESTKHNSTDITTLRSIIIDDSYGNPHKKYKPTGVGGNDVIFDCDEFWNITTKDGNTHYGIIFIPKVPKVVQPVNGPLLETIEHGEVMPLSPMGIANW
jgi:hypothetical protein